MTTSTAAPPLARPTLTGVPAGKAGRARIRPNAFRRLKTQRSHRVVPLWPQLAAILKPYTDERVIARGGTLLFPAEDGGMIRERRGLLDRIAIRAGWKAGEIRSKMFRHTYCTARLQTLDGGAPVSVFTVSRELGHSSTAMVEKVCSHLGTMRHRSEVVEYRVEQHAATLGGPADRSGGGRFVTFLVTSPEIGARSSCRMAGLSCYRL
jgi:integrase